MLSNYFGDPNWRTDPNGAVLINIPNPAAGADFIYTVPADQRLFLISLGAIFTTSAAVANRNPVISINDGANTFFQSRQATSLTAGTPWVVAASTIPLSATITNVVFIPLSHSILLPGYKLRSSTSLIDVADQWSAIYFQAIKQTRN